MSEGSRIEFEQVRIDVHTDAELPDLIVQWVALSLAAGLDPNSRNPILQDLAAALDSLAFGFEQADTSAASDALLVHLQRALLDVAASGDALQIEATKALADAQAASDRLAFQVGWGDLSQAVDQLLVNLQRGHTDISTALDALVVALARTWSDAAASSDRLDFRFDMLGDKSTSHDAVSANVAMPTADASGASDSLLTNAGKGLADAAGSTDSGVAYVQDYIEDYIEPEYIGRKFTF